VSCAVPNHLDLPPLPQCKSRGPVQTPSCTKLPPPEYICGLIGSTGTLDDIFELQDKVTSSVVSAIAPRLEQAEIERSEREPTESLDVVDLYYRAIHSHRRMTREGNEDALRLAQQAISLDPNFAAAYGVALACYTQRVDESWRKDDDIAEGKQYALRAVEVGADDAYALTRAAQFFSYLLKDAPTADAIVDRAIAVKPQFFRGLAHPRLR